MPAPPQAERPKELRVLIVDENADFRLVLAEYLREGHAGGKEEAGHPRDSRDPRAACLHRDLPALCGVVDALR